MPRRDVSNVQVVRDIGAAERVGREPADMNLQALYLEVALESAVPNVVGSLGNVQ